MTLASQNMRSEAISGGDVISVLSLPEEKDQTWDFIIKIDISVEQREKKGKEKSHKDAEKQRSFCPKAGLLLSKDVTSLKKFLDRRY